ncbi:TetR/AcrR family transcriptional regulator [Hoeflea prorocentri]|uniref:TetR/AcrR family transcriptional regulator n=1 Tax=Hoeflea prorocentri TaxID=1922333 RepID=A0A9X3UPM9_9HYPH|nr:TetR/AcrR family transcriptional regulator [Hoeflea prorocentri]MCY6383089.1 TetR/AcrR family transcriptional regulator [Hoeflea prorocentri]MDA5400889.1 TetR/AcrR family transcriptional regulator [Hoeflea prorocentri]
MASELKSKLVDIAAGILERDGPDALSLRVVARSAGVSHMAPYRHFENKNALLAAVAETGFRALVDSIDRAVAKEESGPLISRAIGLAYIDFARRRPALYQLMFGPQFADHEHYPDLAEAALLARDRCVAAVGLLGPQTGSEGAPELDPLGIAIWSMVHGFAQLLIDDWIDLPEKSSEQQRFVEQVLDVLGRAVPASGGQQTEPGAARRTSL